MKIAISSTGPDPDAQVDLRFGRCRYFILVDDKEENFEFLDNQAAALSGGAGLQAAQMIADADVKAIITGNIGPNAINLLKATGIHTYHCGPGTVRKALQKYQGGSLQETSDYKVGSQSGGGGAGVGRGLGGGRGRTFTDLAESVNACDVFLDIGRITCQLKGLFSRKKFLPAERS